VSGGCMQEQAIEKLRFIIEKYKRMPDNLYLLHEVYKDKGIHDISYIFEVREYNEEEAKKSIMEDSIIYPGKKDEKKEDGVVLDGFTSLSSSLNHGGKYSVLSGKDIALRATRLKAFLENYYIQPPGEIAEGKFHFGYDLKSCESKELSGGSTAIECRNYKECAFRGACPKSKKYVLSGLRYTGGRTEDTKSLQTILFKFGYGDEIYYTKYGSDGIYGKHTRLAAANLIGELNAIEEAKFEAIKNGSEKTEKRVFEPVNGELISMDLANEINLLCGENYERKKYYLFKSKKWDLYRGIQDVGDEFSELQWKYHVKSLQADLKLFAVTRMKILPKSDAENALDEDLDLKWRDGIFDLWTERAVIAFQEAASAGMKFDPVRGELTLRYELKPTFTGKINGIVDTETKMEIERWFRYIEGAYKISDFDINDAVSPENKLSGMRIVTPMLACSAIAKEQGKFKIILAKPEETGSIVIDAEDIRQNLKYFLFLHQPADKEKPFAPNEFKPTGSVEDCYTVFNVQEFSDEPGLFYKGTSKPYQDDTRKPAHIDSPLEDGLKKCLSNSVEWETNIEYNDDIRTKIWNIYDRKYPGLVDKLKEENYRLWTVTLQLDSKVTQGMYLLKLKDSDDLKPHPLRVFGETKKDYRIAHITDLHVASRYDELPSFMNAVGYNNPNDRLRDFIKRMKDENPDFVVITGDVVDYANNHRPYDSHKGKYIFKPALDKDANWRILHSILTYDPGINIPFYICPGNHDFKPNPSAVEHMAADLNISRENASKYPFDLWDTAPYWHLTSCWLTSKCYGDILYGDENSLQYYFENFCPYTDYNIAIDGIRVIMMSSGTDNKLFINDYTRDVDEAIEYVRQVFSGECPAPIAIGFSKEQLAWLKNIVESNRETTNIFCMHSTVINPEVKDILLKESAVPQSKKGIKEDYAFSEDILVDESGILMYEGWGRPDIMEREGWLTPETKNRLSSLTGDTLRNWLPYSKKDVEFIREKINIIDIILKDISEFFYSENPKWPNENVFKLPEAWIPHSEEKLAAINTALVHLKESLSALIRVPNNVSSVINGRDDLINMIEEGKIKIALCGHVHKNMELRCENINDIIKWYIGNYSAYKENLKYFNEQENGLVLSTISAGMAGHGYRRDGLTGEVVKDYGRTGYRMIELNSDGKILGFKSFILWDKNAHNDLWDLNESGGGYE
jgi:Icc-related predicted phosphoesterase